MAVDDKWVNSIIDAGVSEFNKLRGVGTHDNAREEMRQWAARNQHKIEKKKGEGWDDQRFTKALVGLLDSARTRRANGTGAPPSGQLQAQANGDIGSDGLIGATEMRSAMNECPNC